MIYYQLASLNNARYADGTMLMADSDRKLRYFLDMMLEESGKNVLTFYSKKTRENAEMLVTN